MSWYRTCFHTLYDEKYIYMKKNIYDEKKNVYIGRRIERRDSYIFPRYRRKKWTQLFVFYFMLILLGTA